MKMPIIRRLGAVAAVTALVAVAGCSTKAGNTASSKTGVGISGNVITLGVMTDLTGTFAALGKDVTDTQQLFWDQQNGKGGICGKYQVKLLVKDHGYVVQNAVQLYAGIKDEVLAVQQTVGSPINTALADQLQADKLVNIPQAWALNLTKNPYNVVPGATYDVEMINGIDYLLKQNKLKDGDTVGHIYFEGEYGEGGLLGSKHMADLHHFNLVEEKIKATDKDMTAQVTDLKAKGAKAIFITVGSAQTASVAGVAESMGLDVPILGNNPVYDPGLLATPAGDPLKKNLYIASPFATFDQAPKLLADFKAKYPDRNPSLAVVAGYGAADIMRQILEKACANGDMTRDGLMSAKNTLTAITTDGLIVTLDPSKPGVSPSKSSYILRPADVPGGARRETDLYTSNDLTGYSPA